MVTNAVLTPNNGGVTINIDQGDGRTRSTTYPFPSISGFLEVTDRGGFAFVLRPTDNTAFELIRNASRVDDRGYGISILGTTDPQASNTAFQNALTAGGGGGGGGTTTVNTSDREIITADYQINAGVTSTQFSPGDIVRRIRFYDVSTATPTISSTVWENITQATTITTPPTASEITPATSTPSGSGNRAQVIYRLNNGETRVGYIGELSPSLTLFADLAGTIPVTIGTAPTEANIATVEPARAALRSTQSFPISHASATVNPFTQPAIGSQVTITATHRSSLATMPQFSVGSSVFLADGDGVQVGGHYIIRSAAYPSFSIELQDPTANELGAGQTVIAPGATTPSLEMIALSKLVPPVGVTHAVLSVTRPNTAIVSAISGANSATPAVLQQSQKDRAQVDYPSVALNFAPSTLGWDAGPKTWVVDSVSLSRDQLSCWLYAWADEGRTVHATVRWFGGVQ